MCIRDSSVAGGGVDLSPTVRMKKGRKFATFNVSDDVLKKFKSGKKKYSKWKEYLNMEDDAEQAIYNYARKNPRGVISYKTKLVTLKQLDSTEMVEEVGDISRDQ